MHFTLLSYQPILLAPVAGFPQDLQVPTQPLRWEEVYDDSNLPLALDIGCGYGRFPLALSRVLPTHNLLGLEIREQVGGWVEVASMQRQIDPGIQTARLAAQLPGRVFCRASYCHLNPALAHVTPSQEFVAHR